MTNRICIVDLDGVVADSTARFAKAEEAKVSFIDQETDKAMERYNVTHQPWDEAPIERKATVLYWQTAFDPELVKLDTRIEGVDDALLTLDELGYKVVFLTSRPEAMREATLQWLLINSVYGSQHSLIMKAPAFQFVKTVTWKAGMVQTLAALYDADIVKFIDDEEANWQELLKHTPYIHYSLEWIASLAQAVANEEEGAQS